jgi:hypothetical protein
MVVSDVFGDNYQESARIHRGESFQDPAGLVDRIDFDLLSEVENEEWGNHLRNLPRGNSFSGVRTRMI